MRQSSSLGRMEVVPRSLEGRAVGVFPRTVDEGAGNGQRHSNHSKPLPREVRNITAVHVRCKTQHWNCCVLASQIAFHKQAVKFRMH